MNSKKYTIDYNKLVDSDHAALSEAISSDATFSTEQYRAHSVDAAGVIMTCSTFGGTEPTENECKQAWDQLANSGSWVGSTSYRFMLNGCVLNTGLGAVHDGRVYYNSGAGAGPYSGRSLICVYPTPLPTPHPTPPPTPPSSNLPLSSAIFTTTNASRGMTAFKVTSNHGPNWHDRNRFDLHLSLPILSVCCAVQACFRCSEWNEIQACFPIMD